MKRKDPSPEPFTKENLDYIKEQASYWYDLKWQYAGKIDNTHKITTPTFFTA